MLQEYFNTSNLFDDPEEICVEPDLSYIKTEPNFELKEEKEEEESEDRGQGNHRGSSFGRKFNRGNESPEVEVSFK